MTGAMGQLHDGAGEQLRRPGPFERENCVQSAAEGARTDHHHHQQHEYEVQAAGLALASNCAEPRNHHHNHHLQSQRPQAHQAQQQQQQMAGTQQQQQPLQRQYPPNHPLGNSKHLCSICGDRATGKHYGVFSCEGCKGFFKRTIRKDIVYVCRSQGACLIDMRQRNRCQYCRYQKCLQRGMKREAVQEEKQRLKLRAAAAAAAAAGHNYSATQAASYAGQATLDNNGANPNHRGRNSAAARQSAQTGRCDTGEQQQLARLDSTTTTTTSGTFNERLGFPSDPFSPMQPQQLSSGHTQTAMIDHHHHHHHQEPQQQQQHHQRHSNYTFSPQPYHNQLVQQQHHHQPGSQHHRNSLQHQHHQFRLTDGGQLAAAGHQPSGRIDELTLRWAAQVQIERLIDWAKSVPKFSGLLLDDQVTLLKASWNELIIADIAFRSIECLVSGATNDDLRRASSASPPGLWASARPPAPSLNSAALCIGRGLYINQQQAHEIGLGTMFERIINELVCRLASMQVDANELACLRAIILFNPETHGLKTSQPIEEYRGDIYTTLEMYCRERYETEPNRFGKLLLRLPVLRAIGLKCDSLRRAACDIRATAADYQTATTNHNHQLTPEQNLFGNPVASPASSGSSSVNSNCSSGSSTTSSTSSTGVSSASQLTTSNGGLASPVASAKTLGYQVKLLFFDLCYESAAVDAFLRSSLARH